MDPETSLAVRPVRKLPPELLQQKRAIEREQVALDSATKSGAQNLPVRKRRRQASPENSPKNSDQIQGELQPISDSEDDEIDQGKNCDGLPVEKIDCPDNSGTVAEKSDESEKECSESEESDEESEESESEDMIRKRISLTDLTEGTSKQTNYTSLLQDDSEYSHFWDEDFDVNNDFDQGLGLPQDPISGSQAPRSPSPDWEKALADAKKGDLDAGNLDEGGSGDQNFDGAEGSGEIGNEDSVWWDPSVETIAVDEHVHWLAGCTEAPPTTSDYVGWMKVVRKAPDPSGANLFCEKAIYDRMANEKRRVFENMSQKDLRNARSRSNPFENVRNGIFQNRAAMKLCNLDSVFGLLLTEPKSQIDTKKPPSQMDDHQKLLQQHNSKTNNCIIRHLDPRDFLYFVDLCAGPGGFSEYVLWRRSFTCHGIGFTLKGRDDFKLDKFLSAPTEFFETFYGTENDGDIFKRSNIESLTKVVMTMTDNVGVNLVLGDGGFSVEGKEEYQEIVTKRLALCQILTAVSLLKEGGTFLCKLFDTYTAFTAGLIYLLYRVFTWVSIHKPNTSRPANAERYIVCCGYRTENRSDLVDYLFECNDEFESLQREFGDPTFLTGESVTEVVPLDILIGDSDFCQYLKATNERLATKQTLYLQKYRAFAQNVTLRDFNQDNLSKRCLEYWRVPNFTTLLENKKEFVNRRKANLSEEQKVSLSPEIAFGKLTEGNDRIEELIAGKLQRLTSERDLHVNQFNAIGLDYQFFINTSDQRPTLILGLGNGRTYTYDGNSVGQKWILQPDIILPKDTLLLAELTHKFLQHVSFQGASNMRVAVVRAIDAFVIAGVDVQHWPYRFRYDAILQLCAALKRHCPINSGTVGDCVYTPVVPADVQRTARLDKLVINRLVPGTFKGVSTLRCYETSSGFDGAFYWCTGMTVIRPTMEPWTVHWSRSHKSIYLFNPRTNERCFECELMGRKFEPQPYANFCETLESHRFWDWRVSENLAALTGLPTVTQTSDDANLSATSDALKCDAKLRKSDEKGRGGGKKKSKKSKIGNVPKGEKQELSDAASVLVPNRCRVKFPAPESIKSLVALIAKRTPVECLNDSTVLM